MKQTAVEWLYDNLLFAPISRQDVKYNERKFEQAKEMEKEQQGYSEEEVEDLIYNVCGTTARLQGITLNGNHIDTAYKQFKKK